MIHMITDLLHEVHTVNGGVRGEVFHNVRVITEAATNGLFQNYSFDICPCEIDGRGHPGNTTAENQDIKGTCILHLSGPSSLNPLQLGALIESFHFSGIHQSGFLSQYLPSFNNANSWNPLHGC